MFTIKQYLHSTKLSSKVTDCETADLSPNKRLTRNKRTSPPPFPIKWLSCRTNTTTCKTKTGFFANPVRSKT